jgi:hypothetical protein
MVEKYGQEAVDDLKTLSRESIKWTCEQLAEKKIQLLEMARKAEKGLR